MKFLTTFSWEKTWTLWSWQKTWSREISKPVAFTILCAMLCIGGGIYYGLTHSAWGQLHIGLIYAQQDHPNYEKAEYWWQLAADQGNNNARHELYALANDIYYLEEKNTAKALAILMPLAEQGYPIAQYICGIILLYNENSIEANPPQGISWISKAAAQGDITSQELMGHIYFDGDGVSKNYEEAAYWWKLAADQGNSDAQHNLCALANDIYYLEEKNTAKALAILMPLAQQGHPIAQYVCGAFFYDGHGMKANKQKGLYWLNEAAKQGHTEAQAFIGQAYYSGEEIPQNYTLALYWSLRAAQKGSVRAQYNLGSLYSYGDGVKENEKTAARWWKLAADQGDILAQDALKRSKYRNRLVKRIIAKKLTLS
ncbi:MAG: tetratricopeptide repeat protein [bacterium]